MRDLFTVGPVNMFERTLRVAARPLPYFRNEAFSEVMFGINRRLKAMLGVEAGGETILLTTSGTGGMEAAVANLVRPGERVLVVDGGTFGARFVTLARLRGAEVVVCPVPFEADLSREMLERCPGRFAAVLVNMHETSIGKLYDARMVGEFARSRGALYIVDAISAFLADPLDMRAIGADAVLVGSQKALALDAGLCIVALSARAVGRAREIAYPSLYLGFAPYLDDLGRGQPPYTPAVGTVLELADRLEGIEASGVEAELGRVRGFAERFRSGLAGSGLPMSTPAFTRSNCLTPVLCARGDARAIRAYLEREYDIYVTPSGGNLSETLLRVGHIGAHMPADYDRLIEAIKGFYA